MECGHPGTPVEASTSFQETTKVAQKLEDTLQLASVDLDAVSMPSSCEAHGTFTDERSVQLSIAMPLVPDYLY